MNIDNLDAATAKIQASVRECLSDAAGGAVRFKTLDGVFPDGLTRPVVAVMYLPGCFAQSVAEFLTLLMGKSKEEPPERITNPERN